MRKAIVSIDLPNIQETSYFKVQEDNKSSTKNDLLTQSSQFKLPNKMSGVHSDSQLQFYNDRTKELSEHEKFLIENFKDVNNIHSLNVPGATLNNTVMNIQRSNIEANQYKTPEKRRDDFSADINYETARHYAVSPFEEERLVESAGLAFRRHKIDCSFLKKSFEKLAVGGKSNRIFLIGKGSGLYVLEKQIDSKDAFKLLLYEGNESKQFFGIKSNRSGHILAHESKSNDLIVMDCTGEQILRKLGSYRIDFGNITSY